MTLIILKTILEKTIRKKAKKQEDYDLNED